ncbi:5'-nucleotidase C-terminal domain-containing protein [Pseudoflavonifractor capillosus]|uniref:5'-nucleotidase C-terminal domain-containing protein n=1 Tax=Pseudoflavonifractor capillosus TaxID=106588 RepID=A0A921MMR9_9FIRM|nr:5'-nucleotidase C-terminal domain-containing protein [Pseudoflavonifractor capillosus]HJG86651.1 5'-nucleotidase C-terminal domain-containing protein [Pseudoflavonifractor capillosus]
MKKRPIRILPLSLALAMSVTLAAPVSAASLSDVAGPYAQSIEALAEKGIIKGDGTGAYHPEAPLTRSAAASLLYEAFCLVPVFSMEAPAPEANEDGTMPAPLTKQFYSTETTVATLDAVLMPAAPDAVGTWAETVANTVLEARLMDQIDGAFQGDRTMTRSEFALAVMKAVYGADKDMDFLAQGRADGLLPEGLTLDDTVITRGEAALLLDTATRDLTIITTMSTSDIHGNMVPYTPSGSSIEVGGSARAAWLFDEAERRNPNTLILDGGDSPYNTDLANISLGKSSVDVMNAQGYDATVLGNHDFDYSFDNLLSLADRAEYAMLSANTYWKDGTYPEQFEPYIVKEVGGVKVAIVGLTDDGSKATTHYANTQDIDFHDQWEVGQEVVAQADAEADVVIMLSHLHGGNNTVPTRIDGIDMEIGGGNDIFGRPLNIEGTVVVNPGGVGTCVNQTNLNLKDGEVLGYTFNQIILSSDVPEDAEVKAIIEDYQADLDAQMEVVIGQCASDIAWSSPLVRTQESPLGNLAADALRDYCDADIAIQNGGGIRAGLTAGDVTVGDVFAMLPFDNKVTLVEVTGQTVWDALENGVDGYPTTNGKFPQVSGIKYTFDGSKPAGERIVSVTLEDGTPLDLDAWYTLACNDFMCGGGDGYTMLNVFNPDDGNEHNSETAAQDLPGCKLVYRTNDYYRTVVSEYIKAQGSIAPALDGRITILNPQESGGALN